MRYVSSGATIEIHVSVPLIYVCECVRLGTAKVMQTVDCLRYERCDFESAIISMVITGRTTVPTRKPPEFFPFDPGNSQTRNSSSQ